MSKFFVSYNRESEVIVKVLVEDVEALGYTVWFDQDLRGGQVWWDHILAKVRECDVFVFVLTSKALNSTACLRECGYAADLGKPIIPVLVADGISTALLPPVLSQIQLVDYRGQDRNALRRLAGAILVFRLQGRYPILCHPRQTYRFPISVVSQSRLR